MTAAKDSCSADQPARHAPWSSEALRIYFLLCTASSALWTILAWLLIGEYYRGLLGGIMAAPLIGLVAGLVYLPAYRWSLTARLALSLVTLYLGAILFGLACGAWDALSGIPGKPGRDPIEVVSQNVVMTLYGVTMTGFVAFLWPLAYANHWALGRAAQRASRLTD